MLPRSRALKACELGDVQKSCCETGNGTSAARSPASSLRSWPLVGSRAAPAEEQEKAATPGPGSRLG